MWISITEINYAIRWIVIYPVDSAIQRLNNRGLVSVLSMMEENNKVAEASSDGEFRNSVLL